MYKDLISYELAEGVTSEKLQSISTNILESWMSQQDGFISWEIHSKKSGGFMDIVTWENEAAAKAAEAKMGEITNAAEWYSCYKEGSIKTENITLVA